MINIIELMVGDYVYVAGDGYPPAVAMVEEIYGKANKVLLRICKDSVIFFPRNISPIKLSKEFFLKNGFAELYADNHIARLYNRNKGLIVLFYPPDNCFRCGTDKIGIDFVHEFQHYLRLVNLPVYANRLKI